MRDTDTFAQTIARIGEAVRSLGAPDELFAQPTFLAIYESPEGHAASARALMTSADVSSHCKRIIALAMQRLPEDPFVALLAATADSVDHGVTDVVVLDSLVFAPLNWGRQTLIMHFDHPQVHAILTRLLTMSTLSEGRKARIREALLTGQAKAEYIDYMDMIGHPIRD